MKNVSIIKANLRDRITLAMLAIFDCWDGLVLIATRGRYEANSAFHYAVEEKVSCTNFRPTFRTYTGIVLGLCYLVDGLSYLMSLSLFKSWTVEAYTCTDHFDKED